MQGFNTETAFNVFVAKMQRDHFAWTVNTWSENSNQPGPYALAPIYLVDEVFAFILLKLLTGCISSYKIQTSQQGAQNGIDGFGIS